MPGLDARKPRRKPDPADGEAPGAKSFAEVTWGVVCIREGYLGRCFGCHRVLTVGLMALAPSWAQEDVAEEVLLCRYCAAWVRMCEESYRHTTPYYPPGEHVPWGERNAQARG